ncbi:MAG: hypothetical protein AAGB93_05230 [Planctomycetota bacterium]
MRSIHKSPLAPLVLAVVIGLLLGRRWAGSGTPDLEALSAPLVPALEDGPNGVERRVADGAALLAWARADDPIVVVQNRTDALPNELALKAVPLLVDWMASKDHDHYVVRNVNVACDPLLATTTLATVHVPKEGIRSVEFVFVQDRKYGRSMHSGHGLLRFVFEPTSRPSVVVPDETAWTGPETLDDLLVSFEAWREPGVGFDFVAGLTPDSYSITVRAYAGSAYYLQTALKQFQWQCYPLDLSASGATGEGLLEICLKIGDGLMRRVLAEMFESGELQVPTPEALRGWTADDEERVVALLRDDMVPDDAIRSIVGRADLSYHLIARSCMSMTMAVIDLTQRRAADRSGGTYVPLAVAPKELPAWLGELPTAGRADMLAMLPGAVVWLAKNQNVVPSNAWRILRDGGLLRTADGAVVRHDYVPEGVTPWGRIAENL